MTRWMRDGALEQMSMPICKELDCQPGDILEFKEG